MSIVNNRVKEVRLHSKQTQEDFAYKIGISRSNLALIETSKATPTYETIKRISNAYGVNPSYFFVEAEVTLEEYKVAPGIVVNPDNSTNRYEMPKIWPSMTNFKKQVAESDLSQRLTLLRDNKKLMDARLKRDLTKNNPHILITKEKIEDCNTVVEMLYEVINNYFDNAPDPSDIGYYVTENEQAYVYEFPEEVDYKVYRTQFVDYYTGLEPYLDSLNALKACIEVFFKVVAPIDKQEIIT